MSGDRYTLDANVLFYAIDRDAGAKHRLAQHLCNAAHQKPCFLTVQTMAETYHSITRKRREHSHRAEAFLLTLAKTIPVFGPKEEDLGSAISAVNQHSLQFWDAMLWATARRNLCAIILTEDVPGMPVYGGVRYRNPFAPDSLHWLANYL